MLQLHFPASINLVTIIIYIATTLVPTKDWTTFQLKIKKKHTCRLWYFQYNYGCDTVGFTNVPQPVLQKSKIYKCTSINILMKIS